MKISQQSLEIMANAKRYNHYVYKKIMPLLGKNVLEVGCGLGTLTQQIIPHKNVVAIDKEKAYITMLQKKYKKRKNVRFVTLDITRPTRKLKQHFDSILCINVLEHIQNDDQALNNFSRLLNKNGRLILIVPAGQWLYSEIDKANGHHRRYTSKSVRTLFERTNLRILKLYHLNSMGVLYWLFTSKLFRWKIPKAPSISISDRFVPLISILDKLFIHKIGLSLVCIGEKRN